MIICAAYSCSMYSFPFDQFYYNCALCGLRQSSVKCKWWECSQGSDCRSRASVYFTGLQIYSHETKHVCLYCMITLKIVWLTKVDFCQLLLRHISQNAMLTRPAYIVGWFRVRMWCQFRYKRGSEYCTVQPTITKPTKQRPVPSPFILERPQRLFQEEALKTSCQRVWTKHRAAGVKACLITSSAESPLRSAMPLLYSCCCNCPF